MNNRNIGTILVLLGSFGFIVSATMIGFGHKIFPWYTNIAIDGIILSIVSFATGMSGQVLYQYESRK